MIYNANDLSMQNQSNLVASYAFQNHPLSPEQNVADQESAHDISATNMNPQSTLHEEDLEGPTNQTDEPVKPSYLLTKSREREIIEAQRSELAEALRKQKWPSPIEAAQPEMQETHNDMSLLSQTKALRQSTSPFVNRNLSLYKAANKAYFAQIRQVDDNLEESPDRERSSQSVPA
jgi:hypothetical protein